MTSIFQRKQVGPLYHLLIVAFFIYTLISILKTNIFILIFYFFLFFGALSALFSAELSAALRRHYVAYTLFVIYIFAVLLSYIFNSILMDVNVATTFMNLIIGSAIFFIASIRLTTKKRMYVLLQIFLVCSIFSALYGLRQLLFGFFDFELERLAIMGASLREYEELNRLRITSTFGDPLLNGFYMMIAVYFSLIIRILNAKSVKPLFCHPMAILLFMFILIATLTRAPLVGLMVGLLVYVILVTRWSYKTLKASAIYIFLMTFCIFAFQYAGDNEIFSDSSNILINSIDSVVKSVNTLIGMATNAGSDDISGLVNLSKDMRLAAWGSALDYLLENPLGAGLYSDSMFDFTPGDTGLLETALQVGVFGALAFYLLLFAVFATGLRQLYKLSSARDKKVAALLLALWVSIVVTSGISNLMDNGVAALITWIIAGLIVNIRRIFQSNSETGLTA